MKRNKMKVFVKLSVVTVFALIVGLFLANIGYSIKGFDVPVEVPGGETITLTQKGLTVPGLFNIHVIEDKKLGFHFSTIYNRFDEGFQNQSTSVTLGSERLNSLELLSIHWFEKPDQKIGKTSVMLNMLKDHKDPDFSLFGRTLKALPEHGKGFKVLERPLGSDMMAYFIKFPLPVSGSALWRSLVAEYDGRSLNDLTESLISTTLKTTDLEGGKSQYWVIMASDYTTVDGSEGSYTVIAINSTEEKYETEKAERKFQVPSEGGGK